MLPTKAPSVNPIDEQTAGWLCDRMVHIWRGLWIDSLLRVGPLSSGGIKCGEVDSSAHSVHEINQIAVS
jgi:hypothetical protein